MAASTSAPLLPRVSGSTNRAKPEPAAEQSAKAQNTTGRPSSASRRGKASVTRPQEVHMVSLVAVPAKAARRGREKSERRMKQRGPIPRENEIM